MPEPEWTDRDRLIDMLKRAGFVERPAARADLHSTPANELPKDHEFMCSRMDLMVGGGYQHFHTIIEFNQNGSLRSWGSYE